MEKEWPMRKEESAVSEAKRRKQFKKQVINKICLFVCLLIKQDAKGLTRNEHQDYVMYDHKFKKKCLLENINGRFNYSSLFTELVCI